MRTRLVSALIAIALSGSQAAVLLAEPTSPQSGPVPPVIRNYLRLPLAFERRATGAQERFLARGPGYAVDLHGGEATIGLVSNHDKTGQSVSFEFIGSRAAKAEAGPELPGKINYLQGNDPRKWRTGLSTWERVRYSNIYPGIDVVYYGNQRQLEFDLVVKAGADPQSIRMKVSGGSRLSLDDTGALRIGMSGTADLRIELPEIYQEVNGGKKSISGHYAIRGHDEVAFTLDSYDPTRPLVIDPTIVYSSLLGGGLGATSGYGIGVDSSGNILMAGYTYAGDFPTVNSTQSRLNGSADGFVAKINAAGTALIYSTWLGGSSYDAFLSLAVDSEGSAWVTGYTESSDFPVLNAAQSAYGGDEDVVVAKLDTYGALQFSTYLGGVSFEYGYGIAVDSSGNGYVTGYTNGSFPTTPGAIQPASQTAKAFVAKYSPGGAILYSTLLGGSNSESGNAIAADSNGNAYVTGYSYSNTFTGAPAGGAQTTNNGNGDAFVAKLNSNATALLYFTFLGGAEFDEGKAIAVDGSGNVYVAGQTNSTGLATPGAAQPALAAATDGFAAKLNAAGTQFSYVTYLGGSRQDYLTSLSPDGSGNVYLAGYTDSENFPTVSPVQASLPGNGVSLFSSTNSGATWAAADSNIPGAVFDISVNPSGSSAVVLTEAGIYRTVNGGASWTQQLNTSFSGNSSHLGRSPVAPGTIYATVCCSGVYQSTNDGVTWNFTSNPGTQPAGILADPLTASTVYVFGSTLPYVFKSTNGGLTWNSAATGLPASAQVGAMVATSDGSLYAGTFGSGIYKSANQGSSWTAVNNGLPANSYASYPESLSASGTTVYFASSTIYTTTNGGASWAATPTSIGALEVAVSPQDASALYAFTSNNTIQESNDGGATWSSAGTGLSSAYSYANSEVVVDPSNSAHVYVVGPVNQAAFVAKLNSAGSALIWSTYLGGTVTSQAYGIAANGMGDVFITGNTSGQGFPVTSSALSSGVYNAFVTEISDATASCSITVTPGSATESQNSQTLAFSVIAPSGCAWTASTNQSWAVITSASSGSGGGSLTVQLAPNSGTSSTESMAVLTVGSQNITITQATRACLFTLDKISYPVPAEGGAVSPVLTVAAGCPWAVTNNYPAAISVTSGGSGTGNGTINLSVKPNLSTSARSFFLSVGTAEIQINQAGLSTSPALQLVTVAPCRIMDTRNPDGPLGGPFISSNTTRTIPIPSSSCNVPANAVAYSLNVTVVPLAGILGYLTVWPAGQAQPLVSTLNSLGGSVLANAAIVPAGAAGAIEAFATNDTDLVVDINGYFVPPAANTLQFYALTPCRVLDTRNPTGTFGGPSMVGNSSRSFPIPSSPCGAPAGAAAYSLNVTVVPQGELGYLTSWPTGQTQPVVSTLNSLNGAILANAAIVPAGTGGAVSFYVTNPTDVVVDINGYFAPPGTGGLNFYTATPCRLVDTRNPDGTFGGPAANAEMTRSFPLSEGACGLPDTARAYSLNMTVVPQTPILGYLTTWPTGVMQPVVSTLNALEGQVVANAAIVPTGTGAAINVFVTNDTQVVIDTNGYFQ